MESVKIEVMKTVQKVDEKLFAARLTRPFDAQLVFPLIMGFVFPLSHVWGGSTSWATAFKTGVICALFWLVGYFWLMRWQEIVLLPQKLRFISCRFKKDVNYQNMRAISLSRFTSKQFRLSIKLLHPRYTTVSEIYLPRDSCSEILQILAREAPQAEMNELAAKWRDGVEGAA